MTSPPNFVPGPPPTRPGPPPWTPPPRTPRRPAPPPAPAPPPRGLAQPSSGPEASDPPGARLAFYVIGDNGACARFLTVFLVVSVVAIAGLIGVATVSPALAAGIASTVAGALGGRAAARWWRSRPGTPRGA